MIHIYRLFLIPFGLLAAFLVAALPLKVGWIIKIREGLLLRLRFRPTKGGADLWFHACSGEFEYAKPVLRALKRKNPQLKILVTYFSPTFKSSVESFPDVDFTEPLPFDLPGPLSSLLHRHSIKALLIARTDFWPEMIYQCRKRGLPTVVFSHCHSGGMNPLKRWCLNGLSEIFCVSHDDKAALQKSGIRAPIHVTGDTRYDQVLERLSHPQPIKSELFHQKVPIFIAGSTWPEDELVLASSLKNFPELGKVIVPHEVDPAHLKRLTHELERKGMGWEFYSDVSSWDSTKVLVINQVGILAELYQMAQVAFVGGSFRKTVHSVMEALAAGCPTLVGPYHENNREALEFSIRTDGPNGRGWVVPVNSSQALTENLDRLIKTYDSHWRQQLGSLVKSRQGATERLFQWIQSIL